MIIDCISDLHGHFPVLKGGDLLIVAGDITARDTSSEHIYFTQLLVEQPYKKIVMIAGNHDGLMRNWEAQTTDNLTYLVDSGCTYQDFKIWGSPWTPAFYNFHFMKDRGEDIKKQWDLIPDDTEILITHGPPFGILDKVRNPLRSCKDGHAGCEDLLQTLDRLKHLKLHVFGHIHEGYGQVIRNGVLHVNAAIMNRDYVPANMPTRVVMP